MAAAAIGRIASAPLYTLRYDYVSSGVVRGSQTTRVGVGTIGVDFEFNDRGRGPKLSSSIRTDSAGRIASLKTAGVNYYKGAVAERFVELPGNVSWKNAGERETRSTREPRFYVSMDGTPEELAVLARHLLASANRSALLWPEGIAAIKKISDVTIKHDILSKRVTLYEISGLDFAPSLLWLDGDHQLFMAGSPWGALVQRGWDKSLQPLFDAQDERGTQAMRSVAQALPERHAQVAFTGVTVYDAVKKAAIPAQTILITGDRIAAVGDSVAVPGEAHRIDAAGAFVMPGLWDMHQHMFAEYGPRMLAQGVTTIRDPGNGLAYITKLRDQFASGELIGPRVVIAGLIDGRGPYTAPTGATAETPDEMIDAVKKWHDAGAVQIKLYSSLKPELVPVAAREAHARGMRLSGHIPAFMTAQQAIEDGYDEIQHINMLVLNFMFDTVKDTRGPARLTEPGKFAATLDLTSAPVNAFVALMKERGIVSDPTLGLFLLEYLSMPGDLASSGFGDVAAWLPPQVRRGLLSGGMPKAGELVARYRDGAKTMAALVKKLHDSGITLVAGTDDGLPGFDLVRELIEYGRAGIPNADVLSLATNGAAQVMKMDAEIGTIAPGKLADLIVIHGNPLQSLSDLRNVKTTVKGGTLYDSAALYSTAGVTRPTLA